MSAQRSLLIFVGLVCLISAAPSNNRRKRQTIFFEDELDDQGLPNQGTGTSTSSKNPEGLRETRGSHLGTFKTAFDPPAFPHVNPGKGHHSPTKFGPVGNLPYFDASLSPHQPGSLSHSTLHGGPHFPDSTHNTFSTSPFQYATGLANQSWVREKRQLNGPSRNNNRPNVAGTWNQNPPSWNEIGNSGNNNNGPDWDNWESGNGNNEGAWNGNSQNNWNGNNNGGAWNGNNQRPSRQNQRPNWNNQNPNNAWNGNGNGGAWNGNGNSQNPWNNGNNGAWNGNGNNQNPWNNGNNGAWNGNGNNGGAWNGNGNNQNPWNNGNNRPNGNSQNNGAPWNGNQWNNNGGSWNGNNNRPSPNAAGNSNSIVPSPGNNNNNRPRPGGSSSGGIRPPISITGVRPPSTPAPNCNCPATAETNPVCGTDGNTYVNPSRLRCASVCGTDVSMKHHGACTATSPAPNTRRRTG